MPKVDFVRDFFFGGAHLASLPQLFDFFRQRAFQLAQLSGQQVVAVADFHHAGDMPQLDQRFLAFCFRRVGCQHEAQTRLLEQGAHIGGCLATLLQGAHRRENRFFQRAFGFALADDADSLQVLGDVDQLEVVGKSLDEHLLRFQRQALQPVGQLEGGIGIAIAASLGHGTNLFDQIISLHAALFLDDYAEPAAQQVNILAQYIGASFARIAHFLPPRIRLPGCRTKPIIERLVDRSTPPNSSI